MLQVPLELHQHVVDHWDLDHPFERILVDTAVAPNARDVMWINPKVKSGERRKVIAHLLFNLAALGWSVAMVWAPHQIEPPLVSTTKTRSPGIWRVHSRLPRSSRCW